MHKIIADLLIITSIRNDQTFIDVELQEVIPEKLKAHCTASITWWISTVFFFRSRGVGVGYSAGSLGNCSLQSSIAFQSKAVSSLCIPFYALVSPAASCPLISGAQYHRLSKKSGPVRNDPFSFEEMESFLMSV